MLVIWRADVFHQVAAATFSAALKRSLAVHSVPDSVVAASRGPSAANELLVASALDPDRVIERANAV